MIDRISKTHRSWNMRQIRSKDTIPIVFDNASHVSQPLGCQLRYDGLPVCRQAGSPTLSYILHIDW